MVLVDRSDLDLAAKRNPRTISLEFTRKEAYLIESNDVLALSTVSQNGWPHCVPVSYVYLDGRFYVPASSKSKKIRNLRRNPLLP